jgi:NADH:ubiquinone oxidoreductase subunit 6 (subunit J)
MPTLIEEILQLQSENRSVDEKVDDYIKRQRAKDQSRIAWVIIWAFVVAVGGLFVLVIGSMFLKDLNDGWKEPAEFLANVISSVLLPIVTLVLGYYFGKVQNVQD